MKMTAVNKQCILDFAAPK